MFLLLLLRGLIWGAPSPAQGDPVHRLGPSSTASVALVADLLGDARRFEDSCSVLVAVRRIDGRPARGRTEVIQRPCSDALHQGWRVRATGVLRRPAAGPHALIPGAAERLARQGSWSQLRVQELQVLRRPWTPVADARRQIAERLQAAAGEERGGLMAALVLGSAQVQLPADLRQAFRRAGLSHALAASGFHLSVLLGASLSLGRLFGKSVRLLLAGSALMLFLTLAGAQPSVVRAVLMGAAALLIRESGQRSKGFGVLLLSLILMLLIHPAWARSIGFQLSAAATAGLVVSAPAFEAWLTAALPGGLVWLAPALAIPTAALLWTLPLQWLHFGSAPLYGVLANLLATPLLGVLTLASMLLALLSLCVPPAWLAWLAWPVQGLVGLLIGLVSWISSWPGAQLLTGHPNPWLVGLLVVGLLLWLPPWPRAWRAMSPLLMLSAVVMHGHGQVADGVVNVQQLRRHWLLARHQGRAALISSSGDAAGCRVARRLAEGHGHHQLDWVLLLDPVPTETLSCWQALARTVVSEQQGQAPLAIGQRLVSRGLSLQLLADRGQPMLLRAGRQRWWLLPNPQALWSLQARRTGVDRGRIDGVWLGFRPNADQRHWLDQQQAASGSRSRLGWRRLALGEVAESG